MTIRKIITILTLATASLVVVAGQASAAKMWITNKTQGRAVWVSVGGDAFSGKRLFNPICVLPGTSVETPDINTMRVTNVYFRAEFKDYGNGCSTQHNTFDLKDLTMTINDNGRSMVTFTNYGQMDKPTVSYNWK